MSFGCSGKKAASVSEAIQASKAMQTVQQKLDYLTGQAKAFYSSKDFQQTVDVAQFILAYVDKNSQEARNLIEKAKSELTALAQKKAEELKGKISGFAK
jgi:hypothetical protein